MADPVLDLTPPSPSAGMAPVDGNAPTPPPKTDPINTPAARADAGPAPAPGSTDEVMQQRTINRYQTSAPLAQGIQLHGLVAGGQAAVDAFESSDRTISGAGKSIFADLFSSMAGLNLAIGDKEWTDITHGILGPKPPASGVSAARAQAMFESQLADINASLSNYTTNGDDTSSAATAVGGLVGGLVSPLNIALLFSGVGSEEAGASILDSAATVSRNALKLSAMSTAKAGVEGAAINVGQDYAMEKLREYQGQQPENPNYIAAGVTGALGGAALGYLGARMQWSRAYRAVAGADAGPGTFEDMQKTFSDMRKSGLMDEAIRARGGDDDWRSFTQSFLESTAQDPRYQTGGNDALIAFSRHIADPASTPVSDRGLLDMALQIHMAKELSESKAPPQVVAAPVTPPSDMGTPLFGRNYHLPIASNLTDDEWSAHLNSPQAENWQNFFADTLGVPLTWTRDAQADGFYGRTIGGEVKAWAGLMDARPSDAPFGPLQANSDALSETILHEHYHQMRNKDVEGWKAVKGAIQDFMDKNRDLAQRYTAAAAANRPNFDDLGPGFKADEVYADVYSSAARRPEFWQQLATKNPSAFSRVRDFFKSMYAAVQRHFAGTTRLSDLSTQIGQIVAASDRATTLPDPAAIADHPFRQVNTTEDAFQIWKRDNAEKLYPGLPDNQLRAAYKMEGFLRQEYATAIPQIGGFLQNIHEMVDSTAQQLTDKSEPLLLKDASVGGKNFLTTRPLAMLNDAQGNTPTGASLKARLQGYAYTIGFNAKAEAAKGDVAADVAQHLDNIAKVKQLKTSIGEIQDASKGLPAGPSNAVLRQALVKSIQELRATRAEMAKFTKALPVFYKVDADAGQVHFFRGTNDAHVRALDNLAENKDGTYLSGDDHRVIHPAETMTKDQLQKFWKDTEDERIWKSDEPSSWQRATPPLIDETGKYTALGTKLKADLDTGKYGAVNSKSFISELENRMANGKVDAATGRTSYDPTDILSRLKNYPDSLDAHITKWEDARDAVEQWRANRNPGIEEMERGQAGDLDDLRKDIEDPRAGFTADVARRVSLLTDSLNYLKDPGTRADAQSELSNLDIRRKDAWTYEKYQREAAGKKSPNPMNYEWETMKDALTFKPDGSVAVKLHGGTGEPVVHYIRDPAKVAELKAMYTQAESEAAQLSKSAQVDSHSHDVLEQMERQQAEKDFPHSDMAAGSRQMFAAAAGKATSGIVQGAKDLAQKAREKMRIDPGQTNVLKAETDEQLRVFDAAQTRDAPDRLQDHYTGLGIADAVAEAQGLKKPEEGEPTATSQLNDKQKAAVGKVMQVNKAYEVQQGLVDDFDEHLGGNLASAAYNKAALTDFIAKLDPRNPASRLPSDQVEQIYRLINRGVNMAKEGKSKGMSLSESVFKELDRHFSKQIFIDLNQIAKSEQFLGHLKNDFDEKSPLRARLMSTLDGSYIAGNKGGGDSLDSAMAYEKNKVSEPFLAKLQEHGVYGLAKSNDPGFWHEFIAEQDGRGTKNAAAKDVSKAWDSINNYQVARANAGGADIAKLKGRVAQMLWNKDTMGDKQAWMADAAKHLNLKDVGTYEGWTPAERQNPAPWLSAVYDDIKSGHFRDSGNFDEETIGGNKAAQLGARRTLVYNPGGWEAMDAKYGSRGDYWALLTGQMQRLAAQTETVDRMGPNYKQTWAEAKRGLGLTEKDSKSADNVLQAMMGETSHPVDPIIKAIGTAVRQISNLMFLGKAAIMGLNDTAATTGTLRVMGATGPRFADVERTYLDTFKKAWSAALNRDKDPAAQEWISRARGQGAGWTSLNGAASERMTGVGSGITGTISKLHNAEWELNGMSMHNSVAELAAVDQFNSYWAKWASSDKPLEDQQARCLARYNISEAEFKDAAQYIQEYPTSKYGGGQRLGYGMIKDEDLARKFGIMTSDLVKQAVTQPRLSDTALFRMGLRSGTSEGEGIQTVTQYMPFALAVARRAYQRVFMGYGADGFTDWLRNGSNGSRIEAAVAASTMLFAGWSAMNIREMADGREPVTFLSQDQRNLHNVVRVAAASGITPFMNQFMGLSYPNSAGQLMGPLPGFAYTAGLNLVKGDTGAVVRAGVGAVPFTNFPVVDRAKKELAAWILGDTFDLGMTRQFYRNMYGQKDLIWPTPDQQGLGQTPGATGSRAQVSSRRSRLLEPLDQGQASE